MSKNASTVIVTTKKGKLVGQRATEVFVPGKAYDIAMAADFVTCQGKKLKALPDEAKATRSALKKAEKRAKGRGYRYLVQVTPDVSIFLCQWWNEFLASPEYRALGTADALAVRTIATRTCEIASLSVEQKARQQQANAKRAEAMAAGRRAKHDDQAVEAAERVKAYRKWVSADASFHATEPSVREELGLEKPVLSADILPSDADYKLARTRGLI